MRLIDRVRSALWFWRARRALKAGKVEKAGMLTEMIEEIAPGHPGLPDFRREVQEATLGIARQHVKEAPNEPEWRGDYARALMVEKRYEQAAAQARQGLRLLRGHAKQKLLGAEMLQIAAEAEHHLGHHQRALDLFSRGAEPGFAMMGIHYARALCHLGLGDLQACRRELTPLVQKAHWAVGMRYQEMIDQRGSPGT